VLLAGGDTAITTISKFYLLDAATPNTGTMPTSALTITPTSPTGDAAGAYTVRDATDVAGSSNPDIESQITATANSSPQLWGHRRFASRPLAAHAFTTAEGNWTFSYARSESNLLHNQGIRCRAFLWRPSTGAIVGLKSDGPLFSGAEPLTTGEEAESVTATWFNNNTSADEDILVFDVWTSFTQGMNTAYTDQFAYNGTTEGSTTTCATFVTPPVALTLFSASGNVTVTGQRATTTAIARVGAVTVTNPSFLPDLNFAGAIA
jgi:hypothetical protein